MSTPNRRPAEDHAMEEGEDGGLIRSEVASSPLVYPSSSSSPSGKSAPPSSLSRRQEQLRAAHGDDQSE